MIAAYFVFIILLQNTFCYNPQQKRHIATPSNVKNTKTSPVMPARYKITSKANYDPVNPELGTDYGFPEVEYPSNILDSSKPFYVNTSPFSDDVRTTFKHLSIGGNVKKSTTDAFWEENEKLKQQIKEQALKSKNVTISASVPIGNEINTSPNTNPNAFLHKYASTNNADHSAYNQSQYMSNDFNPAAIKHSEDHDMDYVISFINDLDEFMTNLTFLETSEFIDGQNYSYTLESKCSNEPTEVTSSMMRNNNDSIIEFNGNSFLMNERPERIRSPLFEESDTKDVSSIISLINEDFKDNSAIADMQGNFCTIGKFANETNSSCIQN